MLLLLSNGSRRLDCIALHNQRTERASVHGSCVAAPMVRSVPHSPCRPNCPDCRCEKGWEVDDATYKCVKSGGKA